jgi:hypothetical protein
MTDRELDQKLKAARTPALEPDYADDLPRLVFAQLRSTSERQPADTFSFTRLVWGGGAAFLYLLVGLMMVHSWRKSETASFSDLMQNTTLIRETLAMFPNQVRAIMQDEHGINVILADQPNVPGSAPLYVRISDGKSWSSFVTFSGQDIQISGQNITVLSDVGGGIILEGNHFLWSKSFNTQMYKGLNIRAKSLQIGTL